MANNVNDFNLYRKEHFEEVIGIDLAIQTACDGKANGLILTALGTAYCHHLYEMIAECEEQLGEKATRKMCADAIEFIMRDLMAVTKKYNNIKIIKNGNHR